MRIIVLTWRARENMIKDLSEKNHNANKTQKRINQ
jgi:hypothetical protein